MRFPSRLTSLATLLGSLLHTVTAADCEVHTAQSTLPNYPVALQTYSYCAGYLNVTAYIQNLCYNKIVELYYEDGTGKATPLTVISLGWNQMIDGTDNGWEQWGAQTPVYLDGVTRILNLTYQAVDIGKEYAQTLNLAITASGNPPPAPAPEPSPLISPEGFSTDITNYLKASSSSQAGISKTKMFKNINVPGAVPGTVIAAQSYSNPDYAYHWVRDASLTMDVVVDFYAAATKHSVRGVYEDLLWDYVKASVDEQNDPTAIAGLGEPKFYLNNNTGYLGPWGRGQNDGPATRAITLMRFANAMLDYQYAKHTIITKLWDSKKYPTQAPILRDLLFVAANWSVSTFDLWEEESSDHFYTRMVQRRALLMGAEFATSVGYPQYTKTLTDAANAITATLSEFWDPGRELLLYEYGPVLRGKSSYKDIAVVLGVLHGYNGDGVFSATNDQVLATAYKVATSFLDVYPIAKTTKDASGLPLGVPIGRYPEDVYDGVGTSRGNPWYLTTAAMAELFYTAASSYTKSGSITVTPTSQNFWNYFAPAASTTLNRKYTSGSHTFKEMVQALEGWGDAWIRTVKYYAGEGGSLPEEFDRESGKPVGAKDLTWSYASVIAAGIKRAEARGDVKWLETLANL